VNKNTPEAQRKGQNKKSVGGGRNGYQCGGELVWGGEKKKTLKTRGKKKNPQTGEKPVKRGGAPQLAVWKKNKKPTNRSRGNPNTPPGNAKKQKKQKKLKTNEAIKTKGKPTKKRGRPTELTGEQQTPGFFCLGFVWDTKKPPQQKKPPKRDKTTRPWSTKTPNQHSKVGERNQKVRKQKVTTTGRKIQKKPMTQYTKKANGGLGGPRSPKRKKPSAKGPTKSAASTPDRKNGGGWGGNGGAFPRQNSIVQLKSPGGVFWGRQKETHNNPPTKETGQGNPHLRPNNLEERKKKRYKRINKAHKQEYTVGRDHAQTPKKTKLPQKLGVPWGGPKRR